MNPGTLHYSELNRSIDEGEISSSHSSFVASGASVRSKDTQTFDSRRATGGFKERVEEYSVHYQESIRRRHVSDDLLNPGVKDLQNYGSIGEKRAVHGEDLLRPSGSQRGYQKGQTERRDEIYFERSQDKYHDQKTFREGRSDSLRIAERGFRELYEERDLDSSRVVSSRGTYSDEGFFRETSYRESSRGQVETSKSLRNQGNERFGIRKESYHREEFQDPMVTRNDHRERVSMRESPDYRRRSGEDKGYSERSRKYKGYDEDRLDQREHQDESRFHGDSEYIGNNQGAREQEGYRGRFRGSRGFSRGLGSRRGKYEERNLRGDKRGRGSIRGRGGKRRVTGERGRFRGRPGERGKFRESLSKRERLIGSSEDRTRYKRSPSDRRLYDGSTEERERYVENRRTEYTERYNRSTEDRGRYYEGTEDRGRYYEGTELRGQYNERTEDRGRFNESAEERGRFKDKYRDIESYRGESRDFSRTSSFSGARRDDSGFMEVSSHRGDPNTYDKYEKGGQGEYRVDRKSEDHSSKESGIPGNYRSEHTHRESHSGERGHLSESRSNFDQTRSFRGPGESQGSSSRPNHQRTSAPSGDLQSSRSHNRFSDSNQEIISDHSRNRESGSRGLPPSEFTLPRSAQGPSTSFTGHHDSQIRDSRQRHRSRSPLYHQLKPSYSSDSIEQRSSGYATHGRSSGTHLGPESSYMSENARSGDPHSRYDSSIPYSRESSYRH